MPLTNSSDPITMKDLDDLITTAVKRSQQQLLSELQSTRLEVENLRIEIDELKQQVPPKLKKL